MKNLLSLLLITVTLNTYAQAPHGWFISVGQDVKMSYQGPHGQGGALNPEISAGIQFTDQSILFGDSRESLRVSMKYEWFTDIQYTKYTYFAFDYDPGFIRSEKWNTFVGLELSVIYRYDPILDFYNDNLSAGINFETIYWISDHIGAFANCNIFTAEAYDNKLNPMKPTRWDVRCGIAYIF